MLALKIIKELYSSLYNQLRIRRNLFHLQDRRIFRPLLGEVLCEAARIWPEVLPWKPETILDVGAHRGDIAAQLSQLYHPSFMGLVEPLPQMAPLLQGKSFAVKQKFFPCVLGRAEGKTVLKVLANLPSSSLLEPSPGCDQLFNRAMDITEYIQVPMRTLDSIFSECALTDLDLLKIDVQGYEIEVFLGGLETLRKTRLIVSEVSFFKHYQEQPLFQEIYSFLNSLGFELRATFGYFFDAQGIPLQCDAVFINRDRPMK
jgi:FkbM family methyltransferase